MDHDPGPAPTPPPLGHYRIDPARSVLDFRTRHLFGLLPVTGGFRVVEGEAEVTEPLGDSRVRAVVDAASFSTGNPRRDRTVRSPRFLDVERHPRIVFEADRFDARRVHGTLRVRGVEAPVSLTVHRLEADPEGGFTVRAHCRVDRLALGVTGSRGLTGRRLEIGLDISWTRG